ALPGPDLHRLIAPALLTLLIRWISGPNLGAARQLVTQRLSCFLKGLAINVGHDGDPRRRCRISNLVLRARSVNTCLRSLARRRPGKTPRKIDTSNPLAWHICARKQSTCFWNWPSLLH